MTSTRFQLSLALAVLCAASLTFADIVIPSTQGNGVVTWTNASTTNAVFRIEWSTCQNGPWHRTMQMQQLLEAQTNVAFGTVLPIHYRVVMSTNPPPTDMVLIDPGKVVMGNNRSDFGKEKPEHTVMVSAFWIGRYEVSQALWDDVYGWATNHGYALSNDGRTYAKGANFPVTYVSWHDCVKWCNARSEKEGLTPVYYRDNALTELYRTGTNILGSDMVIWNANGYRLPTEAEWEKAARGGLQGHWYSWSSYGGTNSMDYTNYYNGSCANAGGSGDEYESQVPPTSPIGYYNGSQTPRGVDMANRFGLYDMVGNVNEWCWDWFSTSWYSAPSAIDDDTAGPMTGSQRSVRGGGWYWATPPAVSTRGWVDPLTAASETGFRCVRRP